MDRLCFNEDLMKFFCTDDIILNAGYLLTHLQLTFQDCWTAAKAKHSFSTMKWEYSKKITLRVTISILNKMSSYRKMSLVLD